MVGTKASERVAYLDGSLAERKAEEKAEKKDTRLVALKAVCLVFLLVESLVDG